MLTSLEQATPVWQRVRAHILAEIDSLRSKNDSLTLDATQTAAIRGEIAALRKLMGAEKAPPDTGG